MRFVNNRFTLPVISLLIFGLYLLSIFLNQSPEYLSLWSIAGYLVGLFLKIFGVAYAIKAILIKNKIELPYRSLANVSALSAFISTGIPQLFLIISPVFPDGFPWIISLYIIGGFLFVKYLKDQTQMPWRQAFFTVFFAYFLFFLMIMPFTGILL